MYDKSFFFKEKYVYVHVCMCVTQNLLRQKIDQNITINNVSVVFLQLGEN